MGADARIFQAQRAAFPNLRVPAWIKPRAGEGLSAYAARFAPLIDPGVPFYLGGASFGGLVALEAARHLRPLAVFLIGSARSPREMHAILRALRPLAGLAGQLPFWLLGPLAGLSLRHGGHYSTNSTRILLRHLAEADGEFLRWGTWAVLSWRPARRAPPAPVHQIHGEKDPVFPAALSRADEVLPGAGHLLSLTRGAAVNAFLAARMCGPG
jgi:pimeloyl-ACP methyl ester carboxylesterase